jgi:hypothetical protein
MSIATQEPSLPPEIARLGQPERVFDLSAGKATANSLLAAAGGVVGLLCCLGMAIPTFVCGVKPYGQNPPSPDICFFVAGVLTVLGLAVAISSFWYALGGRRSGQAYHIYRDCLAVVGADGDVRRIAWEQIGPTKEPGLFSSCHIYPVDGEAEISFASTVVGHEELAEAITQKSTLARWGRLLTEAAVSQLSSVRPARAFLVYDVAERLLFRVSPLAGHLLFVQVGNGPAAGTRGFAAPNVPAQGGLAGAAAGWRQMKQAERLQRVLDNMEGLDERGLFELAASLPGSRLIAPDELAELHFAAPALWAKLASGVTFVGVLQFRHADWGDKKLHFESLEQLAEAANLLQQLLGRDFKSEIRSLV